jgi:precorrin-2 dehydrogenase/sirohydrochlorin ferrochelatase
VIDRGQVVAAVGTAGAAPILAALLRGDVEAAVPPGAGRVAALLKLHQDDVRAAFPDLPARRAFLREVLGGPAAQAAQDGDMERASDLLTAAIQGGGEAATGRVSLIVGEVAGDLVSLRAVRALGVADAVVSGPAGEALVRAHARRDVERSSDARAGAIAALARAGRQVAVVVAGGEGALAEELAALGIAAEVMRPAPAS